MMKKIPTTIAIIFIAMGFSACSESGDAAFRNAQTIIPISISCTEAISTYQELLSGDAIVKDDENTTLSIYHDTDGNKKVCLVSGTAHIVR